MVKYLNQDLKGLKNWTCELIFESNPIKINTTNRKKFKYKPNIYLHYLKINNALFGKVKPVYLGITLNTELPFGAHIKNKLALIKCLVGKDCSSPISCLTTTYQVRVRPCLQYGIPIWAHVTTSNLSKPDKIQNHVSRIKTGAARSTPVKVRINMNVEKRK